MPTDPLPAGMVRHPSGCLQPVLLRGRVDHIDGATGELLHRYTTVHIDIPATRSAPARTLAWGRQLDTRPITTTGT